MLITTSNTYQWIATLIFLCCITSLLSQTKFDGIVKNEIGIGLPDISVMLMIPEDSTIVDYYLTDEKGNYKLTYNGNISHLLVTISAFDIKRQSQRVENKSQTVNFTTEEGSIVIQEVIVKPTKMWGEKDTINYLVSEFKGNKDLVIGDVLKKIPGINVKESGEITYKGKPINKFYIEDMDMLQGRYGIATTNVSADDLLCQQDFVILVFCDVLQKAFRITFKKFGFLKVCDILCQKIPGSKTDLNQICMGRKLKLPDNGTGKVAFFFKFVRMDFQQIHVRGNIHRDLDHPGKGIQHLF